MKKSTSLTLAFLSLPVLSTAMANDPRPNERSGAMYCELRASQPEGSEELTLPQYRYILETEKATQNIFDSHLSLETEPLLTIEKIDYVKGTVDTIVSKASLQYLDSGLGHSRYTAPFSVYGLTVQIGHISSSFFIEHNVDGNNVYNGAGSCFVL
jgi:hypothetical protein